MEVFPKIVAADIPGQEQRFYLVDQNLDFISEVQSLVDQKANTRCSPNTTKALCYRLRWYYQFLEQRKLNALNATATHLSDFVLWLSNPYRAGEKPILLQDSTINQILSAVGDLYKFLHRRGAIVNSPVVYKTVQRYGKARVDKDLLAHVHQRGYTVQQMELKLKEQKSRPKTVSPADFEQFIKTIHTAATPAGDPAGFRDQLILHFLRESGMRCGEILGNRMADLDFGAGGIHVRFRPDNENGCRAKAGYGRDRFLHLPSELLDLLDVYLTEVWVNANCYSDYLWVVLKRNAVNGKGQSTFGKALTPTAVNKMFAYYSKRSGIDIHPHMLRHTHATDLVRSYLNQGEPVDWKFISDRLGHATIHTTMNLYVHLTQEDSKNAYKQYLRKKEAAHAK